MKMEDVLDVYQRPYDPDYPVVCFDETRKELHSTPLGGLPPTVDHLAREDYQYQRHGTASLFLWYEPKAGRRGMVVSERQTGYELAGVLKELADQQYPHAKKIVLVCDNLSTHSPACLYERFSPEEAHRLKQRFEWHYTPEHGSWLNIAECELSVLSRQCLSRRIPDFATLEREVTAWEQKRNREQVRVDWQFTTKDARGKLHRLYPTVKRQPET
jgi:hypothetical protein